jgi:hypothetical protein
MLLVMAALALTAAHAHCHTPPEAHTELRTPALLVYATRTEQRDINGDPVTETATFLCVEESGQTRELHRGTRGGGVGGGFSAVRGFRSAGPHLTYVSSWASDKYESYSEAVLLNVQTGDTWQGGQRAYEVDVNRAGDLVWAHYGYDSRGLEANKLSIRFASGVSRRLLISKHGIYSVELGRTMVRWRDDKRRLRRRAIPTPDA